MGGPDMAPQTPLSLVAPRRSRGAPRFALGFGGPDMAPPRAPAEPWRASIRVGFWGALTWPPRRAPTELWRASIRVGFWGPRHGPPSRPDGAVARLDSRWVLGGPDMAPPRAPAEPWRASIRVGFWGPRHGPPLGPGGAVARLDSHWVLGGPDMAPQNPRTVGAPRGSRGVPSKRRLDRIERSYYFQPMRKGEQTREAILVHALRLATKVGFEGLTIGRLADELKLSKSGLFAHFKSKENLQLQVLDRKSVV